MRQATPALIVLLIAGCAATVDYQPRNSTNPPSGGITPGDLNTERRVMQPPSPAYVAALVAKAEKQAARNELIPRYCSETVCGYCKADFNKDGEINVTDINLLLGGWGEMRYSLDCDGVVNVSDLLILLGEWGSKSRTLELQAQLP